MPRSSAVRRDVYAAALAVNCAAPDGSALVSASRIRCTAALALTGSCHQCGSYRDASGPDDSPATLSGTLAARSTTRAWPPDCETTLPIQWSRPSPLTKASFELAVSWTSD